MEKEKQKSKLGRIKFELIRNLTDNVESLNSNSTKLDNRILPNMIMEND